jgi:outer membrane protein assembly factor BamB
LGADGAPVWVRESQFFLQEAPRRRRALPSLGSDGLQDSGRETPSFRPVGHLQPLWSLVKSGAADPVHGDTVNLSLLSLRTGNPVWEARVQWQSYLVGAGLGLSGRFDAAAGALAVVDGGGVRVLGLGTGETWWERTWPHEVATGVAVRGERVLVRLGNQSTVVVLDRRTGAEQGRLWFDESPPQELWCHWDAGAVLCLTQSMANDGFQQKRRFTLTRRALPGGETLWEQPLPEGSLSDPNRLFVAGAERFGFIGADGRLSLQDLASGKLLWTNPAPDGVETCHVSYQPAAERLWVARFTVTVTRSPGGAAGVQKAGELIAIDLTTGNVVLRQPLPDMAAGTSGLIGPGAAPWYVTLGNANIAGRTNTLRALPVGSAEAPRAPWTEPVPAGSILACARDEYLAVDSPGGLLIFQPVSGKDSQPK